MTEYRVVWETHVEATDYEEAAQLASKMPRQYLQVQDEKEDATLMDGVIVEVMEDEDA